MGAKSISFSDFNIFYSTKEPFIDLQNSLAHKKFAAKWFLLENAPS